MVGYDSHDHKYCDPQAAAEAAHVAEWVSRRMSRTCRILDRKKEDAVPRIFRHELVLGNLLGRGGFSNVYEIRELDLSEIALADNAVNGEQGRKAAEKHVQYQICARRFLSEHCLREKTGDARYAVKFLRREVMAHGRKFRMGAADLAVEARLLSSLDHPNIVKMRGVAAEGGEKGFASGLEGGHFIVMDRLFDTLAVRIDAWRELEMRWQNDALQHEIADLSGRKRREFLATRLNVAFDIAGALKYLHGHNIIFRDLKPENVGFDVRGDVKIFDFGLAKEVDRTKALEDGTYKLSVNTGSRRYMAPEVALGKPYNFLANSYSFGTLLWEMTALETPYDGWTKEGHENEVLRKGWRPVVPNTWPVQFRTLIKRSWSENIGERPSIEIIYHSLKDLITKMRIGDDTGLEHARRRSTHIMKFSPGMARCSMDLGRGSPFIRLLQHEFVKLWGR